MLNPATRVSDWSAETDAGLVRPENEDSIALIIPPDAELLERKGVLAVVADGVGGGNGGKIASSLAVTVVAERYYASGPGNPLQALSTSVLAAHREILGRASGDPSLSGMATTCTAFLVLGGDGFICHVGDSRAYLLRNGNLRQLTEDHTLVNNLVRDGLLTPEAAEKHPQRNVIVKALGITTEFAPETVQVSLQEGDLVLLCSDGLHGLASDDDIASVLTRHPPREAGKALLALAQQGGGSDNVSVALLAIGEGRSDAPTVTRSYPGRAAQSQSSAVTVLIFALLAATLLYLWFSHGLNRLPLPHR